MKARQKLLYNTMIFVCLLVMLAFSAKTFSVYRELYRFKPEARTEMRHLFRRIQLGDSPIRVHQAFTSGRYKTLKLRGVKKTGYWSVSTPYEFGSGNWVLYIEFDERSRVATLRIRTVDGVHDRPREPAPQDEVSPTWKKPFFPDG